MNDVIQLSELGEIITGNTPSTSDNANYESDDILFVKPSDISNDRISYIENTENYISNYAKEQARVVPSDTVFCTCIGIIGKVGIATKDSAFNQQINAIIPDKNKVTSDYLAYALMAKRNYMQVKANAAVVPIINKSQFAELKIKYVSLEEQRCITDKFQLIDSLIAKREKQIETMEYLAKSRFIEMFGDPVTNPMGWERIRLADKCEIVTGNTPSRKVKEYYGNDIEWIKSDNITEATNLTTATEYLSDEGAKVGRIVEAGSILMTCIAGSLRSIGNVAIADRAVAFNQQINAILPNEQSTYFMYEQFRLSKEYICSGVNMALKGILSKGQLSEIEFIFPPVELQKQFADFVSITDKSKLTIQKSMDNLQELRNSLLQEYFG